MIGWFLRLLLNPLLLLPIVEWALEIKRQKRWQGYFIKDREIRNIFANYDGPRATIWVPLVPTVERAGWQIWRQQRIKPMRWSSVSIDSSKRWSSALAMTDGNDRTEVLPIVLGVQAVWKDNLQATVELRENASDDRMSNNNVSPPRSASPRSRYACIQIFFLEGIMEWILLSAPTCSKSSWPARTAHTRKTQPR